MRINFDDDLVIVKDSNGKVIYKGIEDYEPMKDYNWKYDIRRDIYTCDINGCNYTKVCVDDSYDRDDEDEDDLELIVEIDDSDIKEYPLEDEDNIGEDLAADIKSANDKFIKTNMDVVSNKIGVSEVTNSGSIGHHKRSCIDQFCEDDIIEEEYNEEDYEDESNFTEQDVMQTTSSTGVYYPNGMEVTDIDLDTYLDYYFGTDRDKDNSKYSAGEKQRSVDYWFKKHDTTRGPESTYHQGDEDDIIEEDYDSDDIYNSDNNYHDDYYYDSDEINEDESDFIEIDSKLVRDSDDFLTEYTMYKNINTGEYVFVFGDRDIYSPQDGNFDWSCDSEDEALHWFNSYKGFEED